MEWYGAFGLLVTLVWLYLEILRLLSKLNRRRAGSRRLAAALPRLAAPVRTSAGRQRAEDQVVRSVAFAVRSPAALANPARARCQASCERSAVSVYTAIGMGLFGASAATFALLRV